MELAAARHGCKVCGKSFPCGRSLGGHMRSHLSLSEAAAEADVDEEVKHDSASFNRSSSNGVVGYGLREQPRKTRRLSDFADEEEEEDYCGDGDRDGEHKACRQCGKLFGSWRSLFGHMRSHASGGRDRDEEEEEFVPEEAEAEEVELMEAPVLAPAAVAVLAAAPRRRRRTRTMRVAAPAPVLPPVMSGFEKEQEDVALCLLMLSRDTGLWSSPIKGEEPFFEKESNRKNETKKQACLPKNSYAYNSDEDSTLLEYGGGRIKTGSGVAKRRKRSSPKQQQCQAAAPKRTRYECPWCGKVFSSYQALGGHRASHKRINTSCSAPKAAVAPVPAPEPSAETHTSHSTLSPSASPDSVAISIGGGDTVSGKAKASTATVEKFECPICFKVFASGQALCAHKRSHLPADDGDLYDAGADQEEQHIPAATGFFDLNFPPAPAGEA